VLAQPGIVEVATHLLEKGTNDDVFHERVVLSFYPLLS